MAMTARPIGMSVLNRSWTLTPTCLRLLSARRLSSIDHVWQQSSASGLRPFSEKPPSHSLPDMRFRVAASASGKGRTFKSAHNTYDFNRDGRTPLGIQRGRTRAQRRASRPDSGQDAFFVATSPAKLTTFGVADGVGGWASSRVDPADFSHGICQHMADAALKWADDPLKPRDLMEVGYDKINTDPSVWAGGSTACIGVAGPDGTLHMANLGDSGFLHLRLGAVHRCSEPQTHEFNTPYQLTTVPPSMLSRAAIFGGMPLIDLPEKADLSTGQLYHGDVLILATDGVWDNLNPQEVLSTVSSQMRSSGAWSSTSNSGLVASDKLSRFLRPGGVGNIEQGQTLQGVVAAAVAGEAKLASMDERRESPFAKAAQRHYPEEGWQGGKVDDICVIALIAVDGSSHGCES